MTPAFESVQKILKELPGLGYRSSERIALSLLVEKPERLGSLINALQSASASIGRCKSCGNISEGDLCTICTDTSRSQTTLCVVEHIQDLHAIEKSGSYRGLYHILHGRLSPIHRIGPDDINLPSLKERIDSGAFSEAILALSNDIEAEATCHYIQEHIIADKNIHISRIGFGLPSGSNLMYADNATLKSALDRRQPF